MGLAVSDVVVLIDRQQGGEANLRKHGIALHAAFTLAFICDTLAAHGLLAADVVASVRAFVAANQTSSAPAPAPEKPPRLSYEARLPHAQNAMARRCLEIMLAKRSNLAFSVDVATEAEMLRLADAVGPHICVLKTHVDIFDAWTPESEAALTALAEKHNFLVFEDRKFADIGNTVVSQYGGGVYHIARWSHLTNAHLVPGPGIIAGLRQAGAPLGRGLLLLAEMSSAGNLATGEYTAAVLKAAEANQV